MTGRDRRASAPAGLAVKRQGAGGVAPMRPVSCKYVPMSSSAPLDSTHRPAR